MNDLELNFWDKIQSGYYQAKYPKFDYKEYEEELIEQLNDMLLTKTSYDLALEKIKESIRDLKTQHLQNYRKEESRLNKEFCKDCEIEFEFSDFPDEVKDFIHSKAYEEGRAYGSSEIANKYEDLVEFAKICKEAFTNG